MSLADELLADLEEAGHDEEVKNEVEDVSDISMQVDTSGDSVHGIAKLMSSGQLTETINAMKMYMNAGEARLVSGPVEADPEYRVIVQANNLTVEIDNEINIIHKFVRDKYSKRFPELESLVTAPLDYILTVKALGNNLDAAKNNEKLLEILTSATIMVVSVTASTTQGTELTHHELEKVEEACDMAVRLNECKLQILEYVESRMSFIAPNVSIIVGAATAAKLMGAAGGLTILSKMPACNILLVGSQKRTLSGFSTVAVLPHTGFIYYSPLVQDTPPDLRRKAARLVSAKCAMAARVDACHESSDGKIGHMLKEDIEKKLDKLQEPPPIKQIKALPAPIEQSRKKRGGKRVRRMKERLGVTELRKQANRMSFGDIEEDAYQEDLGFSSGVIGKGGHGRIRGPQIDEKTRVRISKTLNKTLTKKSYGGVTTIGGRSTIRGSVSGTASSVAFTPLQGLEIINPGAAEKKMDDAKYFSSSSGFLKVKTPLPQP
ncbi:PREDICTED: U4/U6 small nuclear ribonucleoprotein Prp31-like [Priapulus caudatus]|uniref:U4/U6 small nuclear ribonucleoprotein Prp31 n=1 Tax=Priapulus caudatus TaxID=37621 RepID=A0ABM1DNS3_PRICU|nr:PREDICTED: U4/U6 small nuclear ribonucleoprotein Prp31-like [Priapulus caudatus]XP_014661595.1 PREDICTED: U4/U6 small nuclear ribonucleoprotein Prp31-like [Priapulus caudatus]